MSVVGTIHGSVVHGRRVRVLAKRIAEVIPAGARVLDIGCGDGLLASRLETLRPDLTIEGVDVLVREHTHIPVEAFDGARIPHADGAFDCALFVDVLHHTEDPEILLSEAARVARTVVVKDHLREGLLAGWTLRLMDWVGNAPHGVALPYNYWREARWRTAFERLGLKVSSWNTRLGIYPWPGALVFGRGLHFVARLDRAR